MRLPGRGAEQDLQSIEDRSGQERRVLDQLQQSRKVDWDRRVAHHPPRTRAVVQAHEQARALVGQVGQDLIDLVPPCPEVERMLDSLHDALMLANAAIALHHPENHAPVDVDVAS